MSLILIWFQIQYFLTYLHSSFTNFKTVFRDAFFFATCFYPFTLLNFFEPLFTWVCFPFLKFFNRFCRLIKEMIKFIYRKCISNSLIIQKIHRCSFFANWYTFTRLCITFLLLDTRTTSVDICFYTPSFWILHIASSFSSTTFLWTDTPFTPSILRFKMVLENFDYFSYIAIKSYRNLNLSQL